MPFRLRHLQHNLELVRGEFVIGRSADCQLALDDPLVSRRHAALLVSEDSVVIRDLGSRNGVMVNGIRIQIPTALTDGDRIVIGTQEMVVLAWTDDLPAGTRRRGGVQTMSMLPAIHVDRSNDPGIETSKRVEALRLLASLADKAFALGRPEEAERLLATVLQDFLRAAREGRYIGPEALERAAQYAVRLAAGGAKAAWIDYIFALFKVVRRPCPASVVDELHLAIRKAPSIDLAALRSYLEVLQAEAANYGPADRFLVQRIAGLERLASLR